MTRSRSPALAVHRSPGITHSSQAYFQHRGQRRCATHPHIAVSQPSPHLCVVIQYLSSPTTDPAISHSLNHFGNVDG